MFDVGCWMFTKSIVPNLLYSLRVALGKINSQFESRAFAGLRFDDKPSAQRLNALAHVCQAISFIARLDGGQIKSDAVVLEADFKSRPVCFCA